ncbi:FAD-binding protein [Gammaproteobacteria bacterium]|jgi:3-oxosteroid 1-dehydrogenase|nr:FAD-binding protein [Gammaproteobacteria bacterium]MDC0905375.1 FAD-binding protein [Gammaproteobacteria bacterium]
MEWNYEFDVVVVGSGNGALTAALCSHDGGAKTLVIEKSSQFGGTSATSGGGVWIPNNRYAKAENVDDSDQDARNYINSVSPEGMIKDELIETYISEGPRMIDYLHENSQVKYRNLAHYPDYFPDNIGGKEGNRSIEPEPIFGTELGDDLGKLREQHPQTAFTMGPINMNFTQVEGQLLLGALPGWKTQFAKLFTKYILDFAMRLKWGWKDRRLTMGNAGIARLILSLKDRKVDLWTLTAMTDLVDENGKVIGIKATKDGSSINIKANKGVILAAGGFERDQDLRDKYLPKPSNAEWSAANIHNTGDALKAALKLGADTHQMDTGWWSTTMKVPGQEKGWLSMVDKSMPGNYTVNKNGERFSNESQNYVSFVNDMFAKFDEGNPCAPCYMIFDSNFRKNRPCGPLLQGSMQPDSAVPKEWWTPSFLSKGETLEELAEIAGIDPEGLRATQAKVNEYAVTGKDLELQRGDSAYDRYYGDPSVTPNPCLAPLKEGPFYCMVLYPGEMGTAGGLVIDTHARVLKQDGQPIAGLYACGNVTTALLPTYPGPGSTLGPAMTFGYLAAKDITGTNF